MQQQLTLSVQLEDEATFANYLVSDHNQALLHCLQHLDDNQRFIYLWGEQGVGKTHLLQAICHQAMLRNQTSSYIPLTESKHMQPELLQGMQHVHYLCLDDIQAIACDTAWEEALFHLYNLILATDNYLIIAANHHPTKLNLKLADLISRLTAGLAFQIKPLSDEDKLTALMLRAKARGLVLPQEVGEFLLRRWSRDMNALFEALVTLDQASWQMQRKLTIPFIKEILGL